MQNLKDFLSPFPKSQFFDEYIGTKTLYIPGKPEKSANLFSWKAASDILTYSRHTMEGFRLVLDKKPLPETALQEYEKWLEKGATLVINNLDKIHPPVFDLANALELEFNTSVNVNTYLSCPTVQAFDVHYDQHDVYIVQLEGVKKWAVYNPTVMHPTHIMGKGECVPPDGEPDMEFTMSPGDVAYVPRGHWHYAIAETPSVHLTIGPAERTPIHFMHHIMQKLLNNDAIFRKDFALADAAEFGGSRTELKDSFDQFTRRLDEVMHGESLFEAFIEYIQTSNTPRRSANAIPDFWEIEKLITPETNFKFSPTQKSVLRYDPEKKFAVVMVRGKVVDLVSVTPEILNLVFESGKTFNGEDLMRLGDTSWEVAKKILVLMYRESICILL